MVYKRTDSTSTDIVLPVKVFLFVAEVLIGPCLHLERKTVTIIVLRYTAINGYGFFHIVTASSIMDRRSTFATIALRSVCQAITSRLNSERY